MSTLNRIFDVVYNVLSALIKLASSERNMRSHCSCFKLSINISTLSSFMLLTFLNVLEYIFASSYLHNTNISKWSLM